MSNKRTIDELEVLTPDQLGRLLHAEVREDSPDVKFIQDLLYVGCPIDARSFRGRTPLHIAAKLGKGDILKLLISLGADVNIRTDNGWTAWDLAIFNIKLPCRELKPK